MTDEDTGSRGWVVMKVRRWLLIRTTLVVVIVAGLVVDAWVHFDLASDFHSIRTSTLDEGQMFRVEGVSALLAAAALAVRPRRYTAAFAFVVSAGGTAAVLFYAHVDVGVVGPIPNMYDPVWYPEKTLSAWAEGIAAVAALTLLTMMQLRARRATRAAAAPERAAGTPRDKVR